MDGWMDGLVGGMLDRDGKTNAVKEGRRDGQVGG